MESRPSSGPRAPERIGAARTAARRPRRSRGECGAPLLALLAALVLEGPARAQAPALVAWEVTPASPPAHRLEGLLPADARIVTAAPGELLRISATEDLRVGRLFVEGISAAVLDETDRLQPEPDGRAWRYRVPLGNHAAVVVAGRRPPAVWRARAADAGYAWEVYEDRLVAWARAHAAGAAPPAPPSAAANGAWVEVRGAAALLEHAGALGAGARDLEAALGLVEVALARPWVGPTFRAAAPLRPAARTVAADALVSFEVTGPLFVEIEARRAPGTATARPAPPVAVRLELDGRLAAGGPLPARPRADRALDGPGAPATWRLRVPRGPHRLGVRSSGGAARLELRALRKRVHVADAVSGDEDIERRAAAAAAGAAALDEPGAGPTAALVRAEALRLGGERAAAALALSTLIAPGTPPAVRGYAAWRLGELTADPADAGRFFAVAEDELARLPAPVADAARPAIARCRALRAAADGDAAEVLELIASWPALAADPRLAPGLAAADDTAPGAPRLAAALEVAPPGTGRALRRAFWDRTAWTGATAALGEDTLLVLAEAAPDASATDPGSVVLLGDAPVTVEVPADPLGTPRYRTLPVHALARGGPALDAALRVDPAPADGAGGAGAPRDRDGANGGAAGTLVPIPTVLPVERHRVAVAPGRHAIRAEGRAQVFLELPDPAPASRAERRYRSRRYAPVGPGGLPLPIDARRGLVGVHLRALEPGPLLLVEGVLEVDGVERAFRLRAVPDPAAVAAAEGRGVSAGVTIDLIALDARSLRVRRRDPGRGTLLVRPLVRATAVAAPPPARTGDELRGRLAAARAHVDALLAAPAPGAPGAAPGPSARATDALRRLSLDLRAASDDGARASIRLARATLLARLGRHAYAREDLRAAAALPGGSDLHGLLRDQAHLADAAADRRAYPLDASAAVLRALGDDPSTLGLARRAWAGEPAVTWRLLARTRADATDPGEGALALAAHLDDATGDAAGAAAAYAALARRRPGAPELLVAEAGRRLDAAGARPPARDAAERGGAPVEPRDAAGDAPGALDAPGAPGALDAPGAPGALDAATRAFVASLRAGDAPGAADQLARAADATRWRRLLHPSSAAGADSAREGGPAAGDVAQGEGLRIRAALGAPHLAPGDALWLEPGQVARAVIVARHPVRAHVEASCADLRPHAALDRRAPPPCRLERRLDGRPADGVLALAPGPHSVEIVLAPGGADAVAAVRLLLDAPVEGASPALDRPGRFSLRPRLAEPRWLASPGEPVILDVLGPTALGLDALPERGGATHVEVRETGGAPLARLAVPATGADRAAIPLPEERRYRLEIRPDRGRAAVAAAVREDRDLPHVSPPPARAASPAGPPDAETPPARRGPGLALRELATPGDVGTWTLSSGLRDGALGERDQVSERGGRYLEVGATYRRRAGRTWWQAGTLGRLRLEGDPTGGLGARAYHLLSGRLRLDAGALGLVQGTVTGPAFTAWLDAALVARLPLGEDWFLVPAAGALARVGPGEDPGGDAIDPDVYSRFDAAHDRAVFGQLRLDYEPYLDLAGHLRARLVSNEDVGSLDRLALGGGVAGALARLAWSAGADLEARLADRDRGSTRVRPVLRAGAAYGLWRAGRNRLSFRAAIGLRPGERTDAFVGLAYDWTSGRGLIDFAPPESRFAGQLGPWAAPDDGVRR